MKLNELVRHDLVEGTLKCMYKYLWAVVVVYVQVIAFKDVLAECYADGAFRGTASVADYFAYIFQGMPVYNFSPDKSFSIPILWFAFQIGIAYIIAYYPEKDFRYYGKNMLIACKSRAGWWNAKCIWCVFSVLFYFLAASATIWVAALCSGAKSKFLFSGDILMLLVDSHAQYLEQGEFVLTVLILPCLTTLALSLLQILASFLINPVISFFGICTLYVVSAYYTSPFWMGSYTMWIRSSYMEEGGIDPVFGIILSLLVIFGSVLFGHMYFERCDVF
ncbi:MAG: hypothetical protein NC347_04475 [Clostridium sp.]|nr:hypothetical protein [Clostridium sp.]